MKHENKISYHKYSSDKPWEALGRATRRQRVLEEQEGQCLWCGLKEWRGEALILEVDHIDADHSNTARDNFRALCPNCHSQTPTHMFKNRRHTLATRAKISEIMKGQ